MKRTMVIAAMTVLLAACGSNTAEKTSTTDSTKVKQDSTAQCCDSTKCDTMKVENGK